MIAKEPENLGAREYECQLATELLYKVTVYESYRAREPGSYCREDECQIALLHKSAG